MATKKSMPIPHDVDESSLRLNRLMSDRTIHDADYANGKKRYDAKSVAYASQLDADKSTWAVARFDADASGCLVPSEFEISDIRRPRTIGGEMRRRGLRRNERKTHDASLDGCSINIDDIRSLLVGVPEAAADVIENVSALDRILSVDNDVLQQMSAYVVLNGIMEIRRRNAELDETLRIMSSKLTDGIEHNRRSRDLAEA